MSVRRGFTLLELMVVIAIVALCLAVAIPNLTRQRERGGVETAMRVLRQKMERARTLAAEAGPRIGDPNAGASCGASNCWTYLGCGALAANPGYVWSSIDSAGNYVVPGDIQVDGTTGIVTVSCESGNVQTFAGTVSGTAMTSPAGPPLVFAFGSTGRTIYSPPGAGAYDVFVQLRNPADGKRAGFRVLPSGVFCGASSPGVMTECDVD